MRYFVPTAAHWTDQHTSAAYFCFDTHWSKQKEVEKRGGDGGWGQVDRQIVVPTL
jgi:hypothetical protein